MTEPSYFPKATNVILRFFSIFFQVGLVSGVVLAVEKFQHLQEVDQVVTTGPVTSPRF
jgi:cytochrome bd-type quinol oxidase subunit 1